MASSSNGSHGGSASIYQGLRASVDEASNDDASLSRVEVNQRALIDKVSLLVD